MVSSSVVVVVVLVLLVVGCLLFVVVLVVVVVVVVYLPIGLSASLETKPFCETSSVLILTTSKNAAILRDVLSLWTWQHQKRRNSAILPQFLKLPTSKTKQFCETSFKNRKLGAELTASYQCVLWFFRSICLKYCACHEKVRPDHTKCCACHAKLS